MNLFYLDEAVTPLESDATDTQVEKIKAVVQSLTDDDSSNIGIYAIK